MKRPCRSKENLKNMKTLGV